MGGRYRLLSRDINFLPDQSLHLLERGRDAKEHSGLIMRVVSLRRDALITTRVVAACDVDAGCP